MRGSHIIALISLVSVSLSFVAQPPVAAASTGRLVAGSATPVPQQAGAFASAPVPDARGVASAVYLGGSVAELVSATKAVSAANVWVQDSRGVFQVLAVDAPFFLTDSFNKLFPSGFPGPTAVTISGIKPPPSTIPAANLFVFDFHPDVTATERETTKTTAQRANSFFLAALGRSLANTATVRVDPAPTATSNSGGSAMVTRSLSPRWAPTPATGCRPHSRRSSSMSSFTSFRVKRSGPPSQLGSSKAPPSLLAMRT